MSRGGPPQQQYAPHRRGPSLATVVMVSAFTALVVSVATAASWNFLILHGANPDAAAGSASVGSVQVPDLGKMTDKGALEVLKTKGLKLAVKERRESAGSVSLVVGQSPAAGTRLNTGDEVYVILSVPKAAAPAADAGPAKNGAVKTGGTKVPKGEPTAAKVAVPAVVGKSVEVATKLLLGTGLSPSGVDGKKGIILEAKPAPGTEVAKGSQVILVLRAADTKIPRVLGMKIGKAKKTIVAAGFVVGRVRERYQEDRRSYVILNQSPPPGTKAAAGSAINLVMNEGDD